MNNAGLWLFTREQNPSQHTIELLMNKTKSLGYTLSLLNNVNQTGCRYN
jgi:lipocalin